MHRDLTFSLSFKGSSISWCFSLLWACYQPKKKMFIVVIWHPFLEISAKLKKLSWDKPPLLEWAKYDPKLRVLKDVLKNEFTDLIHSKFLLQVKVNKSHKAIYDVFNSSNYLSVHFLEELRTPWNAFEIFWPLVILISEQILSFKFILLSARPTWH